MEVFETKTTSGDKDRARRLKINNFRTKFWFGNAVNIIAFDGMVKDFSIEDGTQKPNLVKISNSWFARRFPRPGTSKDSGRKSWSYYRTGKHAVSDRLGFHPVEVVAKAYPTTARYFFSPIWRILEGETLSRSKIEEEISKLGLSLNGDDQGHIGKALLDRSFWSEDMSLWSIQAQRFDLIKELDAFTFLETILLLLAWAYDDHDNDLWNRVCNFYYDFMPKVAWEADLIHRFELLDYIDDYAQTVTKVPLREPLTEKRIWRNQTCDLKGALKSKYVSLMHCHLAYFKSKELDRFGYFVCCEAAHTVMNDFRLWENYRQFSWIAINLFYRALFENDMSLFESVLGKAFIAKWGNPNQIPKDTDHTDLVHDLCQAVFVTEFEKHRKNPATCNYLSKYTLRTLPRSMASLAAEIEARDPCSLSCED